MDWQRNVLIVAIVVVFGVLFVRWNQFQEVRRTVISDVPENTVIIPAIKGASEAASEAPNTDVPVVDRAQSPPAAATSGQFRLIAIKTDVLDVSIDSLGGDIVRVALPKYPLDLDAKDKPFVILNRTENHTYIAQSGLVGVNGTDDAKGRPLFTATAEQYVLTEDRNELLVELHFDQGNVTITKQFIFRRGDYLVEVKYVVENNGDTPWRAHMFGQIQRDAYNPNPQSALSPNPFLGAATTTMDANYKKINLSDLDENAFKNETTGGWVAMVQHYFISAWIPAKEQQNSYQLRKLNGHEIYALGYTGPEVIVQARGKAELSAAFYVGPKDQYRLEKIAPYLDLTIDYGWLWWVAKPLFAGLNALHTLVGNWGWAIVLLTIAVKLLFFPLSAASYRSMARMRKVQPEMVRLREECGSDRQKLSQEMMSLYKREKVNPMGGCLPMLIQMPVFIALYWVLNESVELRQTPWILWIHDLSIKDPYFVLPVLNGISMFVLQTLQPAPPDPMQARVMKFMPLVFSFFFMFFPAGLVLYWTVNSVLSIAQQWAITRQIEAA
ncbi:MAG: membrane protein insertase YidC [Porticoccaceae bacterium]